MTDSEPGDLGSAVDTTLERRDADQVIAGLERWLPRRDPRAGAARVVDFVVPSGAGFSNETYVFEVEWSRAGRERLVVQAAPVGEALFQHYDLEKMFRLQRALGERGVPAAPMRWYERRPSSHSQVSFTTSFRRGT